MKKNYFFSLVLMLFVSICFGQVIVSEDFSYPDGSLIPNGGWEHNTGTTGDFKVSSGKAVVQHGKPSEDAKKSFDSVTGDIYAGFDFSVDDPGKAISGTDFEYFAHFGFKARMDVQAGANGGNYTVGISSASSTAEASWATDLTFGETYRAIIKYDQEVGKATLWINPTNSTSTSINGSEKGKSTVSTFDLRQSDSSTNETVRVDNLMIGQKFEDVLTFQASSTPELSINSPSKNKVFAPGTTDVTVSLATKNFTVAPANGGGDGHIHYTLNDANETMKFDTNDFTLTNLPAGDYKLKVWLTDNNHTVLNPAVEATVNFTISAYTQVRDLSSLRSGDVGSYYEVTEEIILTYARPKNTSETRTRNQKYFQDASAGILVDDATGTITTSYAKGDGITGLKGRLSEYNGVLQFVPAQDPGTATSTGNTVNPKVVTLADYMADAEKYESMLLKFENVTFSGASGNFEASKNYNIESGGTTTIFRTNFKEANYLGEAIPTKAVDLIVLAAEHRGKPQVIAINMDGIISLSTTKNEIQGFAVYPNPTNDTFVLRTASSASKNISIYNVLGKKVLSQKVTGFNKSINVSNLNSGIYILKVNQEGKTATQKLVIK